MSSLQFLAFFSTHDSTCSNTFKKCLRKHCCYANSQLLKTIFLVSIEAQASDKMTKFPYEVISFDIKHVHQANVVILQITV